MWSETVLKSYNNFTRKNVKKEVSNSIFDIKSEANNLLKKYEELEACCIKNSNVLLERKKKFENISYRFKRNAWTRCYKKI